MLIIHYYSYKSEHYTVCRPSRHEVFQSKNEHDSIPPTRDENKFKLSRTPNTKIAGIGPAQASINFEFQT